MITNQQLAQSTLDAYRTKRLCAQHHFEDRAAFYAYPTHPGLGCAIGVAVPKEMAEELQRLVENTSLGYRIENLAPHLGLEFEDLSVAQQLQNIHDDWANPYHTPSQKQDAQRELLDKVLALLPGETQELLS